MKNLRFEVKVENALNYLADKYARHLDVSTNIISGWVREENVNDLLIHYRGLSVKLIENYK